MNKKLHRVVFNVARNQWVAVSETAPASGKSPGSRNMPDAGCTSHAPASPAPLRMLAALAAAMVSLAHAQIIADPNAPGSQRPTVLTAPNGVPLVNIQT